MTFRAGYMVLIGCACCAGQAVAQTTVTLNGGQKPIPSENESIVDKTLVAWVSPADLTQQGGSCLTMESAKGVFDAIVLGELKEKVWMAGSDYYKRTRREQDGAPEESVAADRFIQLAISYKGREITIYRNGEQLTRYTATVDPVRFGNETLVLFGKRHRGAKDGVSFKGRISDARIYDSALDGAALRKLKPGVAGELPLWAWWPFCTTGTFERMGRFRASRLIGNAKVADGALTLMDEGDTFLVSLADSTLSIEEEGGATTVPASPWNGRGDVPDTVLATTRRLREKLLADPYRPLYHFCVPEGNGKPGDPNGCFWHNGRYHLMYLYARAHSGFCWGHVSSADLLHWRHHPDALRVGPNDSGVFSGGGFVDDDGTAYLTYWMLWGAKGLGIAKSLDSRFDRWEKFAENPVIKSTRWGWTLAKDADGNEVKYASADPSNIWKKNGKYYMVAGNLPLLNDNGRAADSPEAMKGDCVYLFESADLKSWVYKHPFYQRRTDETRASGWTDPDEDNMCPSFLPLPRSADGGALSDKHLLVSISHNRGCQYYIGRYADDRFYPESHGRMTWEDNTYFAPECLMDGQGRQIIWAWLIDNLENDHITYGWSGVYGLPRSLWLADDGTLGIAPVEELKRLRRNHKAVESLRLAEETGQPFAGLPGDDCEIQLTFDPENAPRFVLSVLASDDGSEKTVIHYDAETGHLVLDGSQGGTASSGMITPHALVERAPFRLRPGETLTLRVYVDRSVIEVFANDRQAICRRSYPRKEGRNIRLGAKGESAVCARLDMWEIAPTNPF